MFGLSDKDENNASKFNNYEGRKLRIVPKRDWGSGAWWDAPTRSSRRGGFIVTDGGIVNVIPGAGWFETVQRAGIGIQCLQVSSSAEDFHRRYAAAVKDLPREEWGRELIYGGPRLGLLDPAAGERVLTVDEIQDMEPHRLRFVASLPFVRLPVVYASGGVGHVRAGAYGDRNWHLDDAKRYGGTLTENLEQARSAERLMKEVQYEGGIDGDDFDARLMW